MSERYLLELVAVIGDALGKPARTSRQQTVSFAEGVALTVHSLVEA